MKHLDRAKTRSLNLVKSSNSLLNQPLPSQNRASQSLITACHRLGPIPPSPLPRILKTTIPGTLSVPSLSIPLSFLRRAVPEPVEMLHFQVSEHSVVCQSSQLTVRFPEVHRSKYLEIILKPPLLQAQIPPRQEVLHPTICGHRHRQVSMMFLTLEDHHLRGPLTTLPGHHQRQRTRC